MLGFLVWVCFLLVLCFGFLGDLCGGLFCGGEFGVDFWWLAGMNLEGLYSRFASLVGYVGVFFV